VYIHIGFLAKSNIISVLKLTVLVRKD